MNKYKQEKILVDTQLDEIGRHKSLNRMEKESQVDFKDRVYLCSLNPPRPTLGYFNFAINNSLCLIQKKMFKVHLEESKINPMDLPKIEIKANTLEVWKEQSKDSVLFLNLREEKYKHMKAVKESLEMLDFLSIELIDYEPYLLSKNLAQSSSGGYVANFLLEESGFQNLETKYIKKYSTNNPIISISEKSSVEDLNEDGDYFLDRINGYLYTHIENRGFASFSFENFPFTFVFNPVNINEMNDPTMDSLIYEKQIDEEGKEIDLNLTSKGAELINQILKDNRMYWDK